MLRGQLKHWWWAAALAAATALGFALRAWGLDVRPVWWDEAFTVNTARQDWSTFWMLQSAERHPPLYFLSVWAWGPLAGWSEYAVRFPSLLAGVAAIPLTAVAGRRLFGAGPGLVAGLLMAGAPAMVAFSRDARMYPLFVCLAAAVLAIALGGVETIVRQDRLPGRRWLAGLLLAEGLLLLTHYYAIPLVVVLNAAVAVLLLWRRFPLRAWLAWAAGQLLVLLPLAAWVWISVLSRGLAAPADEAVFGAREYLRLALVLWTTGERDLDNLVPFAWQIMAIVLLLGLLGALLRDRRRAALLTLVAVVAVAAAFLFNLGVRSYHPRYLLPFLLPFLLLLGAALWPQRRPSVTATVAGVLLGLALAVALVPLAEAGVAAQVNRANDQTRQMSALIREHAQPGDVVLMEAFDYTLDYYPPGVPVVLIQEQDEPSAAAAIARATSSARRAWLANWVGSVQDPRRYWHFLLASAGELREWHSFTGYQLYLYDLERPVQPPLLVPRDPIELGGLALSALSVHAGGNAVEVALQWQRLAGELRWNNASLRLLDAGGRLVSQADRRLVDAARTPADRWPQGQQVEDYWVLPLTPGQLAGEYRLVLVVYRDRSASAPQQLATLQLPVAVATADPYRTLPLEDINLVSPPARAPGVVLEAFRFSSRSGSAGSELDLQLAWRRGEGPAGELPAVVAGTERFTSAYGAARPPSSWSPGELVIETRRLRLPGRPGDVAVTLLADPPLELGTLTVSD